MGVVEKLYSIIVIASEVMADNGHRLQVPLRMEEATLRRTYQMQEDTPAHD